LRKNTSGLKRLVPPVGAARTALNGVPGPAQAAGQVRQYFGKDYWLRGRVWDQIVLNGLVTSEIILAVLTALLQSSPTICSPCPSSDVFAHHLRSSPIACGACQSYTGPAGHWKLRARFRHLGDLQSPPCYRRLSSRCRGGRHPSVLPAGTYSRTTVPPVPIPRPADLTFGNTAEHAFGMLGAVFHRI